MSTYDYIFDSDQDSLDVQTALRQQYGTGVSFAGISIPASGPNQVGLAVTFSDASVSIGTSDSAVTNAIGKYVAGTLVYGPSAPSSPGAFGSLDLGAFLNSIGNAIKNAIPGLNLPRLSWLWWIVIGLVVVLLIVTFTSEFGKGLGEGLATRGARA